MDNLLKRNARVAFTLPRGLRKLWPLWTSEGRIHLFCRRHQTLRHEAEKILAEKPVGRVVRGGLDEKYFKWNVAEEDPGNLLSKEDMKNICGPVRNQGSHANCWSHAATDTFSARRVVTGEDVQFRNLSSRYLTFHASPSERAKQEGLKTRRVGHLCHPYPVPLTFKFMKDPGVPERHPDEDQDYSCVSNPPDENPPQMYKIEKDAKVPVSNKLKDLYDMLRVQPVSANLRYFSPEMEKIGKGIYDGPTTKESRYLGAHAVTITAIRRIKRKLVAVVKSSHGTEKGDGGYYNVSLTRMVVGTGDDNTLTDPSLLLFEFCCPKPLVAPEAESGKKKRENQTPGSGRESKKPKLVETDEENVESGMAPGGKPESDDYNFEDDSDDYKEDSGEEEDTPKQSEPSNKKKRRASECASKPPASKRQKQRESHGSPKAKNGGSNSKGKRKGGA